VLVACPPSLPLGRGGMVDIVALAAHPLLLPDGGYSVRRLFNAACRIAGIEPNILLESRAPHIACVRRSRPGGCHHSVTAAD
jgi:LysR family transcriptional regulator, nitrogen assimilation regulatory protein